MTSRARRGRERPRLSLNLTAMIDVTFLLLVYFMVATQFKLGEEVYRLDLPDRDSNQASRDPFELDDEPLRVRISTTGLGLESYTLTIDGPYPRLATFEELYGFLTQRRIDAEVPAGLFLPEHPIIIEPTRSTKWQHVLEAFNAAARAEYTNVTLGSPG